MRGLLNVSSCTHRVNQRACRFANKSHVKVGQGAGFSGARRGRASHCFVAATGFASTIAYECGISSIRFQITEKKDEKANFLLCLIASIISLQIGISSVVN